MSFFKNSSHKPFWLSIILLMVLFIIPAKSQEGDSGHGAAPQTVNRIQCLTEENRTYIKQQIRTSIQVLNLASENNEEDILFESPIRQSANYDDDGFIGISNYVDHNAAFPDLVRDFNCGNRTYDTQNGYNHQGIDYFSWPFSWTKMDNDQVEVVAAAAGTIIFMEGNQYDKSCDFNNNQWNAIYVRHSDGSVAWYGHLKQNSLTRKQLGDEVQVGEYLGIMGSSGNSTGPHLHFEVHDANNNLIDPYSGSCNPTTSRSWWATQEPYRISMVNKLMTNSSPAVFGCYGTEKTNQEVNFGPGQLVYFTTFFRDQITSLSSTHQLITPSGSVFQQWTTTPDQDFNGSWFYRSFSLPSSGNEGKWTFRVNYNGQVTEENFYLVPSGAAVNLGFSTDELVFENITVGQTKTESFTIENTGNAGLIVTGMEYPNLFSGSWDGLIHTGESKEIKVTFKPTEDIDFTGQLTLRTNVGNVTLPIRASTGCSDMNVSVSRSVCEGDTFVFGSQSLTAAGNYTESFQTAAGCDSTVNLALNFIQPISQAVTLTECAGVAYTFGSQQIITAGNYMETFLSSVGCDSTVNLSIDFTTIDLTVTQTDGALMVAETGAAYQWVNCADNTIIPNATGQSFTPPTAGQYKVNVMRGDCELFSQCTMVDVVLGIESNEISNDLRVYPNPTSNRVTVDFGQIAVTGNYELISISGNRMTSENLINKKSFLLELKNMPEGMYFLRITDKQGRRSVINLIKQ